MKVAALALALVALCAGPAGAALAPGDHRIALQHGGLQDYLPRLLGPSTALVDANLEMWRFFQRFQLESDKPRSER